MRNVWMQNLQTQPQHEFATETQIVLTGHSKGLE